MIDQLCIELPDGGYDTFPVEDIIIEDLEKIDILLKEVLNENRN